jgi:hypothetical protein
MLDIAKPVVLLDKESLTRNELRRNPSKNSVHLLRLQSDAKLISYVARAFVSLPAQ